MKELENSGLRRANPDVSTEDLKLISSEEIDNRFALKRRFPSDSVRTLALASLGGALEFYDFIIFIFFAQPLGQLFFPPESPDWLRQFQTFGVFAIGYFVSPIGGILIAHFGDLLGRKRMFAVSILMMAVATLGMGLLPIYSQVGFWAPFALIVLRIVQGAGIGGEVPGAWVFVSEHVPENRVGFACGSLTAGLSVGILLGSMVATTITNAFTPVEISAWVWRAPFVLGGVLGVCSVYLRRMLQETPIFRMMQAQKLLATEMPLKAVIRNHTRTVIVSMLLTWFLSAVIVIIILMTPVLLEKTQGIPTAVALRANNAATLGLIIGCVAAGAIIDRVGPGRFFAFGSLLLGMCTWLFYTKGVADPSVLLPLYALTGLFVGIIGGVPYVMIRAFPVAVRYSGVSFSYNVAYAIFGGLTPLLVSLALSWERFAHLYYLLAACGLGCAVGLGLLSTPRFERERRSS
jgi:MFS family permease